MPQAIVYCDRCGKMIPPGEISRGQALVGDEGGVCSSCAAQLPPEQRRALDAKLTGEKPSAGPSATRGASSRTSPRTSPRGSAPPRSTRRISARATGTRLAPIEDEQSGGGSGGIAVVIVVVGIVAGVAIALFYASNSKKPSSRPAPNNRQTVKPEPVKPKFSPAQVRLAEIKGWAKEDLTGSYQEVMSSLKKFPQDFPDTDEARQVPSLINAYDKQHADRADAELSKAVERAQALIDRGSPEEAYGLLNAVRTPYTGTAWFEKSGKEALDAAAEKVAAAVEAKRIAAIADKAKATVARAEKLFKQNDLAGAMDLLADRETLPQPWRDSAERVFRDASEKQAEIAAAARKELRGKEAWRRFLVGMNAAGAGGLAAVEAHFEKSREALTKLGKVRDLSRYNGILRRARNVEDLAAIGFAGKRGRVNLEWKGEEIAGRILNAKKGILSVRTFGSGGKTLKIPIGELDPAQVIIAPAVETKLIDAAAYYVLRGDLDGARMFLDEATGATASDLAKRIDEIAAALVAPPIEVEPEPVKAAAVARNLVDVTDGPSRGLIAEFYAGRGFDKAQLRLTKVVKAIDFNWGKGAPAPELPADNFSCRFSGEIDVPEDGQFMLMFDVSGRAKLWIGDLDAPPKLEHRSGTRGLRLALKAGWTPIRVEFEQRTGPARCRLSWSGQGVPRGAIGGKYVKTGPGDLPGAVVAGAQEPPEPLSAAAAEKKASVSGRYSKLLKKVEVKSDFFKEGEFTEHGIRDGSTYAGHTGLPLGYWVYVYPHWYIFEQKDGKKVALSSEPKKPDPADPKKPDPADPKEPVASDPKAPDPVDLKKGLLVWWDFDKRPTKGVFDSSGNKKFGMIAGGPAWGRRSGKKGGAIGFDGKNDLVQAPLNPPAADQTIALWIRTGAPSRTVLGWSDGPAKSKSGDRTLKVNANGTISWRIWDKKDKTVTSTTVVADRKWHHVVGAYKKGKGISLYVDGVPQGAVVPAGAPHTKYKSPHLKLGTDHTMTSYFSGIADDIRVYGRALSGQEIWSLAGRKGDAPVVVAAAKPGKPKPGKQDPKKPPPGGKPKPPVGGNRKPLPEKNLVVNAGFEERNEDTRFATKWSKGQWGDRGAKYSVRLDMSNPREGGESAVVVRVLDEGAKAGASTSLKLQAGTYRISYWACAHVGSSATIGAHLGGVDLPENTVGDEYKKFTHEVEVKTRQLSGSFRVWVSGAGARVWFDDVEVVMTMLADPDN